jgi:hypothetical protein
VIEGKGFPARHHNDVLNFWERISHSWNPFGGSFVPAYYAGPVQQIDPAAAATRDPPRVEAQRGGRLALPSCAAT